MKGSETLTDTSGIGVGVLNKFLYGEAQPQGPTSKSFYSIFHEKDTPFVYFLLTNGTPFPYLV